MRSVCTLSSVIVSGKIMELVSKKESARSAGVFFIVAYFVCEAQVTSGVCCSNTGWLSCCGKGPAGCNIFCCNCDGEACRDGCVFDWALTKTVTTGVLGALGINIGKRDVNEQMYNIADEKFSAIDHNLDGFLDLKESVTWLLSANFAAVATKHGHLDRFVGLQNKTLSWLSDLENATQLFTAGRPAIPSPEWFRAIDTDSDNFISRREFDRN